MKPPDRGSGRAAEPGVLARRAFVARLVAAGAVSDPRVVQALEAVPRHLFVPAALASEAYGDHALPIGHGQTITQAANVARSVELLGLSPGARVLEIGTGSGYQTAVLARLCHHVFSLERIPGLAAESRELLRALGASIVSIKVFDGSYGWSDHAPYDGIVVAAAAPEVPEPLVAQLKPGGRLVVPVGAAARQRLLVVRRLPSGRTRTEDAGEVAFVPVVGRFGFAAPGPRGETVRVR
ncbi:MAG TPA: protein-L-isoaspartate(D-aspartate) O-methyltransferase [Thermoanaerobaculia bacterium]|nr:protein-L-isoaspartate(D-aspartate) O-methyltransferase [Thermoanaerobaculia bacterium]